MAGACDPADPNNSECAGCGAPLHHDANTCAYCTRQTPRGTRLAANSGYSYWMGHRGAENVRVEQLFGYQATNLRRKEW